jgi:hypothetical protein
MFGNESLIGSAFTEFTIYVSGDAFLTIFLIFCSLFLIGLIFRIPLEWLAIMLAPVTIYFMSVDPRMYALGGLLLLFIAFIIVKNFWFKVQ